MGSLGESDVILGASYKLSIMISLTQKTLLFFFLYKFGAMIVPVPKDPLEVSISELLSVTHGS